MFGSFRRHQQWIWIFVIAVTIPGFVWLFTPDTKSQGGRPSRDYISPLNSKPVKINDRPITFDAYRNAYAEAILRHFRATGKWPDNDEAGKEALERDAIIRVFMLHKLKELDIHVSEKAAARMAMDWLGGYPMANVERELLTPHGLTPQDFDRFWLHEAGIQQLFGAVTASARLIKPTEAEILYRKDQEEVATDLVVFWTSNYVDKVTVTPAAVSNHYTLRQAQYRVPERVQVSYVEFAVSNYVAEADKKLSEMTNYLAQVNEAYAKRDTNAPYFKDSTGKPLDEAAAKAKLQEDFRRHEARIIARRNASDFGGELYSQPQPDRADNLDKLAAAKGLPVKVTPPFDLSGGLENTNFPAEFREKALKLTKENPLVVNPIVGEEAVYIMSLKNKVPSEMPPLETIREKVTSDYKSFQAWELARTNGNAFAASVTNGLAQKKTFAQICEQAKVKPLSLPPFSPSSPALTNLDERVNFQVLRHFAFSLKPGEASPFYPLPGQEGGMLVYVRAKVPLDETKVKAELPEYLSKLRMYRQNEDFNQWFSQQAQQAKLMLPRKENPSLSPGAMN